MSQSSITGADGRAILCQQDGELSEFADLLADLAVPIQQHAGDLPKPTELQGASVAILHGRRLLDGKCPNLGMWPRTIAVVDASSRTLASRLNRVGVAMVIHRPIHPRALRLLLLHEIYRGPERRGKKRILIGHPIHAKAGLFKQDATLLELSRNGARIEIPKAPKIGSRIRLLVGRELTLGKPVKIDGTVMRCIRPAGTNGRARAEIGISIEQPTYYAKIVDPILKRFAMGPALWQQPMPADASVPDAPFPSDPQIVSNAHANDAAQFPPETDCDRSAQGASANAANAADEAKDDANDANDEDARTAHGTPAVPRVSIPNPGETQRLPPQYQQPSTHNAAESMVSASSISSTLLERDIPDEATRSAIKAANDEAERRGDSRVGYERRIVALGEEAARVLIGRDLSAGGMRIASNESVVVGDILRVALHCGTEIEPVVVQAEVQRDDGDDGLVLTFAELSSTQQDHLEKIIASSAPIQVASECSDGEEPAACSVVLGEMLENVSCTTETADRADRSETTSSVDAGESVEDAR